MLISLFIFDLMKIVIRIRTLTLVFFTTLLIASSALIIHYLEPETFESPFIGLWWVMTTITTTGFGDFVPLTFAGRVFGIILYMIGIGLIGIVIGKIVESFGIYQRLKEEGKLRYKGNNHFVIIGWSKKAEKTIHEISISTPNAEIVLIDSFSKAPNSNEKFVYIQGDPTDEHVIEMASISKAKSVLIFASDQTLDPVSKDGKSLLIASTIEGFAKKKKVNIYTIVEIVKEKHVPNFKHANVDEFVLSNEAFSDLMAKAALHQGSTKLFMQLLSREYGANVWEIGLKSSWQTYNDAYEDLKKAGATLISDHKDFGIIKRLSDPMPPDAKLYVICDDETYNKIVSPV
ncbi:potassium channel family protein [Halalkalibacter akibai]|uniref:Potassium channel protein n=1 Tax=Halalkalibacter akibai (strain ATCC 43226 / DSM 21942 / CIP 109018 / JCM 9157 / 1139) TaxID=1236973 RepID=W4QN24_HALA3|nr:potassium channel family protein [Halalkalibacter akibai]GAE33317.1 potassium channel protein [Halalkalibacter akibai JCM 9157]